MAGAFSSGFSSGFGASRFSRTISGLIFRDSFTRADGAPGANYTIESGAAAIVAQRLRMPASATQAIVKVNGVGSVKTTHTQVTAVKTTTGDYATLMVRRNGTGGPIWYIADIGCATDGTDPNKARIYRGNTGPSFTRIAGGYAPPGFGANAVERYSFSAITGALSFWINGLLALTSADATAANDIAGDTVLNAITQGTHADIYWDDLIVCTGRVITVTGLPNGYKIRANGLTSGASAGGTVSLDLQGTLLPVTLLEVLDASSVVVDSTTAEVFGGDTWAYAPFASYPNVGSGGVSISGTAPFSAVRRYVGVPSGGVHVAGSAPFNARRHYEGLPSGGVIVAGQAAPAHGRAAVGSGGVSIGGSASATHHLSATRVVLNRRSYTGTGEVGDRSIDEPAQGIIISRVGATGHIVARAAGEEGMPKKKPEHKPPPIIIGKWVRHGEGGVRIGGTAPATFYKGSGGPIISPTSYSAYASGGVALGGVSPASSTNSRRYARSGSGGVTVLGSAPFVVTARKSYARTGSGIILLRGSAPSGHVINPPPGGGGGGWDGSVTPPAFFDPTRNAANFTSDVVASSIADIQAKLNTAPPGTRIRVPLGVDWTGSLTIRNRGFAANEWIEVVPDLPHAAIEAARPYGREMTLGIAGSLGLPTLRTPGGNVSLIYCDPGAGGVRMTGLQFKTGGVCNGIIRMGKVDMTTAAQACKRIVADRCTMVGGTTYTVQRGFYCTGEQIGIVGCWIADCFGTGDSQGIEIMGWQGPYTVLYNHIEGWTEPWMIGGAESAAGGVPSDVVIERNRVTRNIALRAANPFGNTVKNLGEWKSVRRARIRYNLCEYVWRDGQDAAINGKSVDQAKQQPQQGSTDVEFAWNWVRVAMGALKFSADPEGGATDARRMIAHNNLFESINTVPTYQNGGLMLGLYGGLDQIRVDHNTWVKCSAGGSTPISLDASPAAVGPIWVRSNLICADGYGMKMSGNSEGVSSWNAYVPNPSNRDWRRNGLVGKASAASYPAGDMAFLNDAAVGYADLANGDYTVTGPAATAGHDGGPLGISDFAAFKANFVNIPG